MRLEPKYIILIALAGFIITLDQSTKLYVHAHFALGESIEVIKNFFNFTYVRNTGAAFGILSQSHETFRNIFFLSTPPIALVAIFFLLKSTPSSDRSQVVALSCIFGGAIGNYIDRIRFSYVIDFLDFHINRNYTWPAFNVADMAIVFGVIILTYYLFKKPELKKTKA